MIHELKVWPDLFRALKSGEKNFEFRKNDRDYKVGDELILYEYDPETGKLSGDHVHRKITWILPSDNPFHNLGDYIIMSLTGDY